ncbi:MAG: cation diffusion facilitator family transporter, partial [Bacteroidetes bacterium]|nr:cation diffusion facilitator family transporter [Bacteroidota bacterium]MBU1579514.1 cation diffusion facilitator family transporter [Bacteroidota bacterium]
MPKPRAKTIIDASWVAILGNAFLSVIKIIAGFLSGSMALVADGIDSAGDILGSLITLLTARIIAKPPNMHHPYGYDKADTIASKLLAFLIFFAGAQLAISTFQRIISGHEGMLPSSLAVIVVSISIIGKQLLARYLGKTGRKIDSPMLKANAKNMQNDVIISIAVLLGLIFTHIFNLPILDSITALLVSVWIMIVAIKIIIKSSKELMDGLDDPGIYKTIMDAVGRVAGAHNPHRVRARKMAHFYMIALDIEIDGRKSLDEAHEISNKVEQEIKHKIKNVYDILIHIEPLGDDRS